MRSPPPAEATPEDAEPPTAPSAIEALAYSPLLPAAIAGTVTLAVARAAGTPEPAHWSLLAATGAFVVYAVDRLRDRGGDRASKPTRSAFFERHARALWGATAAAALVAAALLLRVPPAVGAGVLGVGALGLLHRRLKGFAPIKTLYVSFAWMAVCAGLPWLGTGRGPIEWLVPLLWLVFAANLIASNLRDDEAHLLRDEPRRVLALARAAAVASLVLALLGPATIRSLACIPAAELLALAFYRPTEHYGHVHVDGALLGGALSSLLLRSLL